jgi:glutathionylspermidine synthase
MKRVADTPREGFRETVMSQGLVYPDTDMPDGTRRPYWFEEAHYELEAAEVDYLEKVTEELHVMCMKAAHFLADGNMGTLGLPEFAFPLIKRSLAERPFYLYGRFDLAYNGTGDAKMLEYNADTPTGLVESSVAQWYWLQDKYPDKDQWNSLHERLVAAWQTFLKDNPHGTVHFANFPDDGTGEELMTVAYMRDTATEAGLTTIGIEVPEIGYNRDFKQFMDTDDRWMGAIFKLYPWENMLHEEYGSVIEESWIYTEWIEPLWKVVLSNKALLAALWHLYPNHPNLLPAYLDDPKDLTSYIAKPLHGREGDGIYAVKDGVTVIDQRKEDSYGEEGYAYQQWHELPKFDGNYAVIGSWMVRDLAAGIGIRESDGPITDYFARFVPHVINAPIPSPTQRAEWLADAY